MYQAININAGKWTKAFTVLSILFFLGHLYFLLGLAFMFGASLKLWATAIVLAGPLVTLMAVIFAVIKKVNRKALIINVAILSIYLLYWIPMLPKLNWEG